LVIARSTTTIRALRRSMSPINDDSNIQKSIHSEVPDASSLLKLTTVVFVSWIQFRPRKEGPQLMHSFHANVEQNMRLRYDRQLAVAVGDAGKLRNR
jgi:hypothetical protein